MSGNNYFGPVTTNVTAAPAPLTIQACDPAVCNGPGGFVAVTANLTNPNPVQLPASFTATLPVTLSALPGTCNASVNPGGCVVAANGGTVTWNGNLNPGQTVVITYQTQIANNAAGQLCINSTGTLGGNVMADVQACVNATCPVSGLLPNANIGTSDQKPGSFLVFPYYNSKAAQQFDTRITLSNVGTQLTYAHVFLVDGTNCNQADFYICLTPSAIFSFKTSEYDPENTGFIYTVAVDSQGRPIANNALIGNGFVDEGIYHGNYGAESFWRYDTSVTTPTSGFATLGLNGTQYDAAPIQFAVEFQSPVDVAGQRIVVAPLSGDLSGLTSLAAFPTLPNAAAQNGTGLATNEQEKAVSFSVLLSGGCLKSATISTGFPRVPGGLGTLVSTGKMGLLKFRVGAGTGLLLSPRTNTNRWSGIRGLHKTAVGNVAITIPVSIPVC
ncbi:MAG: hypothetical protein U0Y68_00500 [Blastocatellia bacterium]